MMKLKLLGISGSLTAGGSTRTALEVSLEAARNAAAGVETEVLDLRDYRISFADGRPLHAYGDDTEAAVGKVMAADAVIIASPIYRGSYPGALKNLLDLLPLEALRGKVVGLIANAGSAHHYLALDQEFRTVLAWFGAFVAPGVAYVESRQLKGEIAPDARRTLEQLGRAVVTLSERVRGVEVLPPPLAAAWSS